MFLLFFSSFFIRSSIIFVKYYKFILGEIIGITWSNFYFLRGPLRLLESDLYRRNYIFVRASHFSLLILEKVGIFMLISSFTCKNILDDDNLISYDLFLFSFCHSSNSYSSFVLKSVIGILHTRENIKIKLFNKN